MPPPACPGAWSRARIRWPGGSDRRQAPLEHPLDDGHEPRGDRLLGFGFCLCSMYSSIALAAMRVGGRVGAGQMVVRFFPVPHTGEKGPSRDRQRVGWDLGGPATRTEQGLDEIVGLGDVKHAAGAERVVERIVELAEVVKTCGRGREGSRGQVSDLGTRLTLKDRQGRGADDATRGAMTHLGGQSAASSRCAKNRPRTSPR